MRSSEQHVRYDRAKGSSARWAAFAFAAISLAAMSATSRAQPGNIYEATLTEANQKTPEISTQALRRILADRGAVVLDARKRSEYVAGHIPGAHALDAPPDRIVAAVERLVNGDKRKALVLYCNGPFCQASRRASELLVDAGFSNVQRYQVGIPIWRALGGPTEIEIEGIRRIFNVDRTAVFFDARVPEEFARGSLPGAHNVPVDQLPSGALKRAPLPEDDFNTRIVLFGRDAAQARALAEALSKTPWHNVMYFPGTFESLQAALK